MTYSEEQAQIMSEPEKVLALVRDVECWRLGNWDGCCCCEFSIRNVHIDIACGKGSREQGVWIHSNSMDYDETLLQPIMAEVIRQLGEQSGRGGNFAQYFKAWQR